MSKRIAPEQIERARTAFRSGKSIPECCQLASMSKASFNKYLGKEVKVWLDEHKQAKRIAEMSSELDHVNVDDGRVELLHEPELTYSQFCSYAEFELANCADDVVEIKQVYYQLKEDYKGQCRKVIRLRELYEARLNQIGKSNTSQPNKETNINSDSLIKESTESPGVEVVTTFTQGLAIKSAKQTQQTIKAFKTKYNIKMPVPRLITLQTNEWQSPHRLYEHLSFWYVAHHDSRKAAGDFIENKSLAEYQEWFNSLE